MSYPIEEILKIEKHGETGVVAVLAPLLPNQNYCYPSRSNRIAETPRLEVKCIAGPANSTQHDKVFQNPIWQQPDSWPCELEIEVVTNRTDEETAPRHTDLIGLVRAKLAKMYAVRTEQGFTHPIMALIDVRDQGTVDTWEDDKNLDHTTLSFFFLLQVKPEAWPTNPN